MWGKESKTQWTLAWLSSHHLCHALARAPAFLESLQWNIKGSFEFPTSTNSPCLNMVLGHGKQITTINCVLPHSLEYSSGRGGKSSLLRVLLARNSRQGSDTHPTEESALLVPLSLFLRFNFNFRRSRPFILFQWINQTVFSLLFFSK